MSKKTKRSAAKLEIDRWTIAILTAVVLAIVVPALVIWRRSARLERVRRAYDSVKIGDSRDAVAVAMGEPYKATECGPAPSADRKVEEEFRSKCAQQYRFLVLRTVYTISFDRNGNVIAKSDGAYP